MADLSASSDPAEWGGSDTIVPMTDVTRPPAAEETAATEVIRPVIPPTDSTTVVIEDGVVSRRLRRPLDLARFVLAVAIAAGVVLLAYFATSTTSGIEEDVTTGASQLPQVLVLVINVIGGIGSLGLPIGAAIYLIVRKRVRQLFDALLGLLIAVVVLTGIDFALATFDFPRLTQALSGTPTGEGAATSPIIGGIVAFVTVARLLSRRPWNALSVLVIGSLVIVSTLSGGTAIAGIALSLFIGWALGLLVRYVLGTQTTRPSGSQVAEALSRGGFPITLLRASETTKRGRRYIATTRNGTQLEVVVLDRDLEGAGLVASAWRELRLREGQGIGAFNMRRTLEHSALVSYAAQVAGAPMPRLVLASEVGPDSALLAYEQINGTRFSDLTTLTSEDLLGAWRALRTLHEHQMTHRSLTAEHIMRADDGTIWLLGTEYAAVASSDVSQRIDVAELLCTLALLTDVDQAVGTGRAVLGVTGLGRALPTLQPVALTPVIRSRMRKHKKLMVRLRDALVEIRPDSTVENIQLERIKPRTIVMIVLGTIAAYVLLSQLANIDLLGLVRNANWGWVAVGVVAAIITYFGAAWSLSGFVPEPLKLHRTIAAQVAGDFATLVSPPTLGAIAINLRYLQKAGLHPALAAASVGVSQVAAFVVHITLLFAFGIAAGTQADFTFDPPRWVIISVIAVALVLLALLAIPAIRRLIATRVGPLLREVIPRLITVAQRPLKLLEGIGGILLLNVAYIVVLDACVRAFGGEMNLALVAVVYLAGATIGQAAPTPGGLGAVEAALSAGLIAAGLDGGIAVSAVLLYRLITFWIPTIPGYFYFNWLQKKGAL